MPVACLPMWLRVQAAVWLPALGVIGCWPAAADTAVGAGSLAGCFALSVGSLAVCLRAHRPADAITLVRVVVVGGVAFVGPQPLSMAAWVLVVAAAAADLLDGALARRTGPTLQGARLDMEADQLAVLAMSVCVVRSGGMPHVLLLPAMRYAFVLAAACWRIPAHEPKPVNGDNRRGRVICALVVVALLAALAPGMPRAVGDAATAVATVLLMWSFSADARHLLAHRRSRSAS